MTAAATSTLDNRVTYERAQVVEHYAKDTTLQAVERYVFDKYIHKGVRILDVGVGGGRTTRYLEPGSARYVGIDYAKAMVERCAHEFPTLEFFECDATDLSRFTDASFDVVVFSFNGIDTLSSTAQRERCLQEFRRVLAQRGRLIFSTHNAKALVSLPRWQGASLLQRVWRSIYASAKSVGLALRMLRTQAYWRGEGYVQETTHGGLNNHCAVPEFVTDELRAQGYSMLEVVNGRYPLNPPSWATPWYYYVAEKP